ncbi:Sugar phosphate permease [Enhydrobacter aerosaccus]|uniref:Sugar phosphate permease n=1 Tax=Enhydrobacter aerosaccus TaxID=225324 RepID=A0A1T4R853_9HYPH|nr:MFS transporter [Enhydrobacter aerosaccus]SKA12115.1 Sugar phosphate permease [Enhydrobacter aerosaccus]
MSSTSEPLGLSAPEQATAGWRRDAKVISLISAVHFVSHVHIMLLPPIFGQVREAFGVSYTDIALALTAFNVASALLQTPAGFLVDRIGPRAVLTAGLLVGAAAISMAALLPGYWLFIIAYGLLGVANTVYHPADYSILSATIDGKRIGKAFSIHTFAGYAGGGVTPALVIGCAAIWGWHGAFMAAAILSFAAAMLLVVAGHVLPKPSRKPSGPAHGDHKVGLDLLLSAPILRNLFFFLCLAMANGGIQTYTVVSQQALHGTPASISNIALSGFLLMSAVGVLLGGVIADRTPHHERVAAIGFAFTSTMAILMGWTAMPGFVLILVMSVGGLLNGMIQPSRDMMVRAVTPAGSFGKVFGFVSTGFNLGGMIAPLTYGWLMDHGQPQMIYAIVVAFIFLALVTAVTRRKPQGTPAWTR